MSHGSSTSLESFAQRIADRLDAPEPNILPLLALRFSERVRGFQITPKTNTQTRQAKMPSFPCAPAAAPRRGKTRLVCALRCRDSLRSNIEGFRPHPARVRPG